MALNWTMLNSDRAPVSLPRESTVMSIDTGAEISIIIPDAPPSSSSTAGGSGGEKKLKGDGTVHLTDQRLIFVTGGPNNSFESLSIPLPSVLSTKFEQPYIGSNYLTIDIKPSPEGGLTDGTKAELRFKNQPLFQFVSVLEKTRERAIYMKRQMQEEEEILPAYNTPSASGSRTTAGTPADAPPGYDD
ncbi:hypothetical protein OF83DRAFT_1081743 [Amylostereum chailletii]|nr:hypothetical protein OF83DRAFT_1081743 [Amylostereum chailletii]